VPGSSKYFIEGVVTYANEAKTRALGVEPILLLEHGAVSAPVAEAMAEGIRKRADTDFGLAITGVAGPGGGTEDKPVGTVFVAISSEVGTEHRKLKLPGDRQLIQVACVSGCVGYVATQVDLNWMAGSANFSLRVPQSFPSNYFFAFSLSPIARTYKSTPSAYFPCL
jgi:nicotinamide-nucleotide amidase